MTEPEDHIGPIPRVKSPESGRKLRLDYDTTEAVRALCHSSAIIDTQARTFIRTMP